MSLQAYSNLTLARGSQRRQSAAKRDVSKELVVVDDAGKASAFGMHEFSATPAARRRQCLAFPVVEGNLAVAADFAGHALEDVHAVAFLAGLESAERKLSSDEWRDGAIDVLTGLAAVEHRVRRFEIAEIFVFALVFVTHGAIGGDDALLFGETEDIAVEGVVLGKTHLPLFVNAVVDGIKSKEMAEEVAIPKQSHDAFAERGG